MREAVARVVAILLRLFFRRVEVTGLENVPAEGGGIVVSWHPNGLIDPALIFGTMPRPIVFGARHGLFRWPLLGAILRAVGTVPISRAQDDRKGDLESRRRANEQSLDALAGRVAAGGYACLFPEGDSHDGSQLLDLKTGVARFYYRARQLGERPPAIVPVGLHYDAKRLFRSSVLVAFHPPITLDAELDVTPSEGEPAEASRARCHALTHRVDEVLREAVHATESWDIHHLMHRARKLVRAERAAQAGAAPGAPSMAERTRGLARVWKGYYARLEDAPLEVHALRERLREYDADLRALGLEDHELDRPPGIVSPWLAILLALQVVLVYLLLPPILWFGYIVNAPPVLVLWALTRAGARKHKDEATIKVLAGSILFPLTWALAGLGAGLTHSAVHAQYPTIPDTFVTAGLLTALLSFVGGAVALRYLRLARETMRAVRVRLTRERRRLTIAKLLVERGELFEAVTGMGEGVALPGRVAADGTIQASLPPAEPAGAARAAGSSLQS